MKLQNHGWSEANVRCELRDVCEAGFGMSGEADAVFLDVPRPWEAVGAARQALKGDGQLTRFCSFSPCMEQVQRVSEQLSRTGFLQIETVELVPKSYKVIETKMDPLTGKQTGDSLLTSIPFPVQQPTHTGYITTASLIKH